MARKPEIGNVQIHPNRPLRASDKNGYVLKFYCPIRCTRIRKNAGTRDRREARRIQRECRERLLNGAYVATGGVISETDEKLHNAAFILAATPPDEHEKTWDEAYEHYHTHRQRRLRRKSSQDSDSRIEIAGRIFEARRVAAGLPPGATLRESVTLEAMEYLQDRLLDGAEGRHNSRSPNTVNSMMGAVMTFVRFCHDHDWIEKIPPVKKLDVDEVMLGRPITGEEFDRLLSAVIKVVGTAAAESWKFSLRILWESGFRVADLMDFSWDDLHRIHPSWPRRKSDHPTIVIPSTQKNGKNEEIPMLPGLRTLLDEVPEAEQVGFVVNPLPIEFKLKSQQAWFMPAAADLATLICDYSNVSIAKACGVSEQTVRNWLAKLKLSRTEPLAQPGRTIPAATIDGLKARAARSMHQRPMAKRLTTERVSRIIADIGEEAGVVVRVFDSEPTRKKYASSHDLRRSVAERLINAGVSAETLMVIMRHRDFATTRKFYGAKRSAQSAAIEVLQKLAAGCKNSELVGGLVGGNEEAPHLTAEELRKVKALLKGL